MRDLGVYRWILHIYFDYVQISLHIWHSFCGSIVEWKTYTTFCSIFISFH